MMRGVMIDVAGFKGVEMLGDNYEITVADLEGALQKQNMTLQQGDAVIINTGWGKLYGKDNGRYVKTCPGIGVAAALWLAAKDPMLLGADNWSVEVSPNPDKQLSLPVHQIALVVNGIHLLENMKLDELAAKNVHEFAFIMQPLKIQGRHRIDCLADRGALGSFDHPLPVRTGRGKSRHGERPRTRNSAGFCGVAPCCTARTDMLRNRAILAGFAVTARRAAELKESLEIQGFAPAWRPVGPAG